MRERLAAGTAALLAEDCGGGLSQVHLDFHQENHDVGLPQSTAIALRPFRLAWLRIDREETFGNKLSVVRSVQQANDSLRGDVALQSVEAAP
jgi:hypothetical protein